MKKLIIILSLLFSLFSMPAQDQNNQEAQYLEQIKALNSQIKSRDEEIGSLKKQLELKDSIQIEQQTLIISLGKELAKSNDNNKELLSLKENLDVREILILKEGVKTEIESFYKVINSYNFFISTGLVVLTIIIGLLGYLGYRNTRKIVEHKINNITESTIETEKAKILKDMQNGAAEGIKQIKEKASEKINEEISRIDIAGKSKLDELNDKQAQIVKEVEALKDVYTKVELLEKQIKEMSDNAAESAREAETSSNVSKAYSLYNAGLAYQNQNKFIEAVDAYRRAIEIKSLPEAHNNLGIVLGELGRTDEAIKSLETALEINPDYSKAYMNLGGIYSKIGRHDEALIQYNKSLEFNPDEYDIYNNIGVSFAEMGKLEEALKAYNKALEIKPDYHEAYSNIGHEFNRYERYQEALEACNKALELENNSYSAFLNKGVALNGLGRIEEALQAYEKAFELEPNDSISHYNLACGYSRLGKTEQALSHFRKALVIGYKDKKHIENEKDFINIKDNPRFKDLLDEFFPTEVKDPTLVS